eukprot:symbB.v1.2.038963.t1/scaffold6264.1/size19531/1
MSFLGDFLCLKIGEQFGTPNEANYGPAVRSGGVVKPVAKPKGLVSLGKAPASSTVSARKAVDVWCNRVCCDVGHKAFMTCMKNIDVEEASFATRIHRKIGHQLWFFLPRRTRASITGSWSRRTRSRLGNILCIRRLSSGLRWHPTEGRWHDEDQNHGQSSPGICKVSYLWGIPPEKFSQNFFQRGQ